MLCPMEVVRLTEVVLPLSGNSFVILNNATGFNGQKGVNGPSSELSLPKGIMTQTLEPGCTLKLRNHVIFLQVISNLQMTSQGLLSLTDVIQMIETKQNQKFIWSLVYSALGIAGLIFFILCILLN